MFGALDEHVAERGQTCGFGAQDLACEAAGAGAGFDDEERIGFGERTPVLVERAADERAEQRPHFRTRDEVAPRTLSGCEEAALAVEGGVHESIERDRPFAADQLDEVGQNATSPTLAKSCGYTPTTSTTTALRPMATASGCARRIGVRSSVAAGRIHICTTTRK